MGSVETLPTTPVSQHPDADTQFRKSLLAASLKPIFKAFLESIDYSPPPEENRDALERAMRTNAATSGVDYDGDKHAAQCFVTGISVAGVRTSLSLLSCNSFVPHMNCSLTGNLRAAK